MKKMFRNSVGLLLFVFSSLAYSACDDTLPITGARDDVLIIVNDNSLDSCEVGRYYAEKRNLGQNNIVHVHTRPRHFITFPEFRILMDQIIKYMQDNTLTAAAPAAPACVDDDSFYFSPYYCQASMDHLRQYTKIRYLVTTKGLPTQSPIADSTQHLATDASTSIDNYLSYWLVRYFTSDETLNFNEREISFKDGRGMREVNTKEDGELIVGRIDGITLDSTKALIDRIIAVENNGIYGKFYASKMGAGARWHDYSKNNLVYGSSYVDSWRYQLGLFGEARQECIDYLNFDQTALEGKAPLHCRVRFSASTGFASTSVPGFSTSRIPDVIDDALFYLGELHSQRSGGGHFDTVLKWARNDTCTVKLCENAADPVDCRLKSTDVLKEINTECVGVGEGFMGYNHQSYPVANMGIWPTGYEGQSWNNRLLAPEVRTDAGHNDLYSVWFRNTDQVPLIDQKCYSNSDFSLPPNASCGVGNYMALHPKFTIAEQTITASPQTYQVKYWFKTENIILSQVLMTAGLRVHEKSGEWVNYGGRTIATSPIGTSDWALAETTFELDPTKHVQADVIIDKLEFSIGAGIYVGDIAVDDISIVEQNSGTELISNPSFTEGHKEVSPGDHAAMYLHRLNGVAYWGSLSHHESNGHSFISNPQETLIYFLRGLPLGDSVWWGENHNSGILYGDPVYSPVAIRFDYLNDADYAFGNIALSGSTVNGRDLNSVTTNYEIDYCAGNDFFVCDQNVSWLSTGLSGTGGVENMPLGVWNAYALTPGSYTLRLKVTSNNSITGRTQSLYDYYPVIIYDPSVDEDNDGLSNIDEVEVYHSNPLIADTDGDNLSDGDEVNIHRTDLLSSDTDNDGLSDDWEVANTTDPLTDDTLSDLDSDGLTNFEEFTHSTYANNPDSDYDDLTDGEEVNIYKTQPLIQDTDLDHINDGEEVSFGTDPLSFEDTDRDGLPNDWEFARGTDSNVSDARFDLDQDGVDNIVEFFHDTLPADANSTPLINIIYIDASLPPGTGDGTQTNPYSRLLQATTISGAKNGDIVSLAPGTYGSSLTDFNIFNSYQITGNGEGEVIIEAKSIYTYSNIVWGGFSNLTLKAGYLIVGLRNSTLNYEFNDCRIEASLVPGLIIISTSNVTMQNCVVMNSATAVTGIQIDNFSELTLKNSTVSGFSVGIDNYSSDASIAISNSILTNTIDLQAVTDGSNINYSLISDGLFTGVNGNITGDPLYKDAFNNDYRLKSASPAIDAGDINDSYTNEPTPNGCRVNMGAYGNTSSATRSSDLDNDGLYGYCETLAGTDSNHPDTDHDGVLDGADSAPLDIFTPEIQGINLALDADFKQASTLYNAGGAMHIVAWSEPLDANNIKSAKYTLSLNGVNYIGDLDNNLDDTYAAMMVLPQDSGVGVFELTIQQNGKGKNAPSYSSDPVSITINADTDIDPEVIVTNPLNGSQFDSGLQVPFAGSANDFEGIDLTSSLQWRSSIDGPLGTGTGFDFALSDGTHTITASVTDSGNRTTELAVTVTMGSPPAIVLDPVSSRTKGKNTFVDLSWSGATEVDILLNGNANPIVTLSGASSYSHNIGKNPAGTYSYQVCVTGTPRCSTSESISF